MFVRVPADEAFDGEKMQCAECSVSLAEAYPADGQYFCESCLTELAVDVEVEAEADAREHCKITRPLPRYDTGREYTCSPEDYALGDRESYTPNAYACYCRHSCTNYDELIRDLDKSSNTDRLRYFAIRDRIDELLEEAVDALEEEDGETEE